MIQDINHIPELKLQLKQLAKHRVQVGILGDAEIARNFAVNEFGMKIKITTKMRNYLRSQGLYLKSDTKFIIIPERSTLRTAFDDKKNINKIMKEANAIFDIYENPMNILNRIGILMTAAIQRKIRSNVQPKNHPFTILQKGSSKTLVDSGKTLRSVTHNVL